MKRLSSHRLLPHELFFGLFLIVTWLRLAWHEGFFGGDALLYFALLAANGWAIWFCRSNNTPQRWRLGLLFYPLAMNIAFMNMKTAIPKIHSGRMDTWLQHLDQLGIGMNLSVRLQPLIHPALTETLSFCYLLFFPYLLFSLIYYFSGEVGLLKKFVAGLFTIYGLGFLGYSLVPAAGPYLAMPDAFHAPLTGWRITQWNAAVVAAGSNGVDVFPSLHCAVSSYFLFFDRRHRPWGFKLYLVPCVGLWVSTIYLRYHYAVDVLCGFALAGFALWLTRRFPREPAAEAQLQPNVAQETRTTLTL